MLIFADHPAPSLNRYQKNTMRILSILHFEVWSFLCVLGGMIVYRLLTRQIDMGGIFARKDGSEAASPERIQLLLSTLGLSVQYLGQVWHTPDGKMPEISRDWLMVFGGSSGIYVGVKALTMFAGKGTNQERIR
ncbi:MAG: hypothetical protein JWM43_1284 [Acidobacteriaceae bacterium]|nr:hypothetical protein [Acidobacteriaceae bacterium]